MEDIKKYAREEFNEKTGEELNLEYATKDIWEVLPFTKGFIERNTKTKEDAECIIKKVAEHHKEVVKILTYLLEKAVLQERELNLQKRKAIISLLCKQCQHKYVEYAERNLD